MVKVQQIHFQGENYNNIVQAFEEKLNNAMLRNQPVFDSVLMKVVKLYCEQAETLEEEYLFIRKLSRIKVGNKSVKRLGACARRLFKYVSVVQVQ